LDWVILNFEFEDYLTAKAERKRKGSGEIILDWVILNFECEDFLTAKAQRECKGSGEIILDSVILNFELIAGEEFFFWPRRHRDTKKH
jgi:hypothetical protein